MNENRLKANILYERLSRDDELQGPSNSIVNQSALLEEYAEKNGFVPYVHISDDGYSGTNFQRPGWERLIEQVESGNISTIIIKDLSRMGRDYLRVGLYREMFREKGVRLIAVNDGFDSAKGEDDFTPFKEIIAEWYARDTSKKIKSVLHKKGRDGKPMCNTPIYGYRKNTGDGTPWIIDEEAAEVVRRVFRLAVNGKGVTQIAGILAKDKVERPSYYMVSHGIQADSKLFDPVLQYSWHGSTVARLLERREYIGDLVNFKTHKPSYKRNSYVRNPPEEHMVFQGAIPAIIDAETWELVQKLRQTPRRINKSGAANPLTGMVFCADCGAKMTNRRNGYKENVDGSGSYANDNYECSTNRIAGAQHIKKCSMHYINTNTLRKLILDAIREISAYALNNEDEFMKKLCAESAVKQAETVVAHKKRLAKNEKRIAELDLLFRKVYEDHAIGRLSDDRFERMSIDYEREEAEIKSCNTVLRAELEQRECNSMNTDRFMELARRYTAFDELTTPMLNEFIQKVIIHEADRSSGYRLQKVDIWFNFIGNFELPNLEVTPEPMDDVAFANLMHKRKKHTEAARRYRAKQKEEQRVKQTEPA